MFNDSARACSDGYETPGYRRDLPDRRVRLGLESWPAVGAAGLFVAAATLLLGLYDERVEVLSRQTLIGNVGTVKSIAFRPDGAMISSVGADGSIEILNLTADTENAGLPRAAGHVQSAVFSPDSKVLATATVTARVALHDLVNHETRTLDDTNGWTKNAAVWRSPLTEQRWPWVRRTGESRSGMPPPGVIDQLLPGIRNSLRLWRTRLTEGAGLLGRRGYDENLGFTSRPGTIRDYEPKDGVRRPDVFSR